MSNSKKEKVNKNPSKTHGDIFAIIVVLLIIAGYVFYQCYDATHIDVETITAVTSTVYDTIETKALVVRDESVLNSNAGGVTVACVDDGEKVKLGGNVAMTFTSEENAKSYSTSLDLHSQLDYYIDIESKSAGIATDVESIDKDILSDVNLYIRTVNSNSLDTLSDCTDDLNDKLTRRQIIIGKNVDFTQVKADIETQLNSINIDACKPTGYVTADRSGIFSSYTDGLENLIDYSKVSELDVAALQGYIETASQLQNNTESLGKMITSYAWYFCCVVSSNDVKGINDGDTLNVAVKDTDEVYRCRIISGAQPNLGQEQTVLILQCSAMNSQITSMRLENIEIRFNEYTGFKVPASAVHVDDEGNKCVYALISNQVAERRSEIIYSTEDYVVFKNDAENSNSIRFYDQIITKGKDLHDGKVYS
ncbi:MAG: hypothetical protein K2H13_07005 [Eubacterium sp.]|nr:hypothetical protein [Eubacterium sp.]MDE6767890.1 hypothetical protein [Eubacterium sp.]